MFAKTGVDDESEAVFVLRQARVGGLLQFGQEAVEHVFAPCEVDDVFVLRGCFSQRKVWLQHEDGRFLGLKCRFEGSFIVD